jgi:hypothetical protein
MAEFRNETWVVFTEFEVEGSLRGEAVSRGALRLEVGAQFIPCSDNPTGFRIDSFHDSYNDATTALREMRIGVVE